MQRIVLAYSGGLETTVAIPWLKEHCQAEVIAVTMDLGEGQGLAEVRDRALASGAARAHVLDLREEFARDFILPALQADALDDDGFPMAAALGRPLIAQRLVEIAAIEKATSVAHGCVGSRHGRGRLEIALTQLDPALDVRPVVRTFDMNRREQAAYAKTRNLPVVLDVELPDAVESNLWGRSVQWSAPSHPSPDPPKDVYTLTRSPSECPDEPAYIDVAFERGVPKAINGVMMTLVELTASLGTLAGAHGVGRIDRLTEADGRTRVRHVGEAPAAVVLHRAHRELQRLVSTPELDGFGRAVSREYAALVNGGLWFTPLRGALDAFVERVQQRVTGVVRLKLLKGDFAVVGPAPADDLGSASRPAHIAMTGSR